MATATLPETELLTIEEAAAVCPGKPSAQTIWRWARIGQRSRSGVVVRLRHERIGRRVFIPRDAIREYGEALARADAAAFA